MHGDGVAVEIYIVATGEVCDGVAEFFTALHLHAELRVARDELSIAPEFEDAAFIESEIEFAAVAAVNEQSGVFKINAPCGTWRHGRAGGDPVFPGEQVAPRVMAENVIIRVAGTEVLRETGEKTIVDGERFGQP